jgi:hypothetical protein
MHVSILQPRVSSDYNLSVKSATCLGPSAKISVQDLNVIGYVLSKVHTFTHNLTLRQGEPRYWA